MLEFNAQHKFANLSTIKSKLDKVEHIGKVAICGIMISATLLLSGCGNNSFSTLTPTYNKAIIFGEDCATIIDVEKWSDRGDTLFQIQTKDGVCILTSSYDTKLIDDRNSDISVEDLIRAIKGEDVQINYLDDVAIKERTR